MLFGKVRVYKSYSDFCQSLFILYEESHSGHNMAIKILGLL